MPSFRPRWFVGAILAIAACCSALFSQDPEAVVRVRAGYSLGSGTVFYRAENGDAYILTNHHVAGRKGSRVEIEFWNDGKLQPAVPAIVVVAQIDKGFTDVSVCRVAKGDLGQLDPPFIPLAPAGTKIEAGTEIASRGCPSGVWQCQFIGESITPRDNRIWFYPRPGGGRSGSSVVRAGQNEIVGLLTWSTDMPSFEDHGTDGSGPRSGKGIAQPIDTVWRVLRGETSILQEERPDDIEPLRLDDASNPFSLFRQFRRRSQPPRSNPQPEPPPSDPHPLDPLPDFNEPSDGPQAEPQPDPQEPPPQDEDGILRKRFGSPQPPKPEEDDSLLRRREESRSGPLQNARAAFAGVRLIFRILIWGLAAYGAWCLWTKIRMAAIAGALAQAAKSIAPKIVLAALALPAAAAIGQDDYNRQLESLALQWQETQASETDRWIPYEQAWRDAAEDHKPIIVLLTMKGCAPCAALKRDLERGDRFGLFDEMHTAVVDRDRDRDLAAQFAPECYPTLILLVWNEETKKYIQAARHSGVFKTSLSGTKQNLDGSLDLYLEHESLDAWLKDNTPK